MTQLVRRTGLSRRGITSWCCAFTLAGASAVAVVPVEESVGITRDGEQRTASARTGSMASSAGSSSGMGMGRADPMAGAVAQGTPWASAESDTQTFGGAGGGGGVAVAQRGAVAAAPASAAQPGQHSEMFYQMQVLQQEVQDLRGLIEELTQQVNRLASDQQAQYRDVDRRLQAMRAGGDAAAPSGMAGAAETRPGAGAAPAQSAAAGAAAPAAALGEREAYSAAFELMRARKFPESTAAFNRFVRDYPSGGYTANAFYWLGELYLAQDDLERARQSFTQVLNLYPDHQKIPDALYKLGVVHHRLGDVGRAREFLNRAVSQHAGSSAAALAQTYLSELQ